jgi:L-lactate utilization protein LutB
MFETSLKSFRTFSKGPGKQADGDWVKKQKAILLDNGRKTTVSCQEFKIWASENLDLLNLMNTNSN